MGKRGTENLVNLPNITQVVSGRASLALGFMLLAIPLQGLALLSFSWAIWEMRLEVLIEQLRVSEKENLVSIEKILGMEWVLANLFEKKGI